MFFNCFFDSCSVKTHLLPYVPNGCAGAHLSRMMGEIVKRLKDSDSDSVECAATIGALSRFYIKGHNAGAVVGLFAKPLFEAMGERNEEVQSGAAMCMARMVESATTPPITCFKKLCPRICQLLCNPTFSAKASLLPVVSSLSQVGAIAPLSLEPLLESIHHCLKSTDWVTRMAAADTLTALASHSSTLIKDKTDVTLAVLHSCWFDKVKPVRESVTQALLLWKKISVKCADGESKISSAEQLGSDKNGVKRSDLPDLMELEEASDCSTHSSTTDTEGEIVQLAEALSHSSSNDYQVVQGNRLRAGGTSGVNKALALNTIETLGNHAAAVSDTYNRSQGASSSCKGSQPAIQMQLFQLERQQTRLINLFQEFIRGSHDSMPPLEGKVRRSESISQDMAKDEAALEAVNVAGQDGVVTRPTRVAVVPEANAKYQPTLICTVWARAVHKLCVGDINAAYGVVFGARNRRWTIMLMEKTGPAFDRLSHESGNKALGFISQLLLRRKFYCICVSWLQQLLKVLVDAGCDMFGASMDLRSEILYNLQQACPRMGEPEQLVVPTLVVELADVWNVRT